MARVTPEPAGAPFLRVLCARVGILNTQSDNFMLPLQRSGNRKTRTDKRLGTTLTYAYDNIYQLLTAKQGTTTKESYTGACPERYSSREAMRVSRRNPVGNRLSSVGVTPYSYNTSNELTSIPGTTYTYDNNGNTKTKTTSAGTTTYTWDYDNRLTQVALPGTAGMVTFKYDPFGRRVQKSFTQGGTTITTNYLYDGRSLLEEVDQNGNVLARYTQSRRIDEPLSEVRSGTTSYYDADGLQSITSLSNPAGALASTYTFDSFGKLTASTGTLTNPFQYTGREFDQETGIYFYRARYYDQNVGRFISEDPLRYPDGTAFYVYANNDPLNLFDPLGLCPWEIHHRRLRGVPGPIGDPLGLDHYYFWNTETGETVGLGPASGIGLFGPVPGQWETNELPSSLDFFMEVPDWLCNCVSDKIKNRGKPPNYCVLHGKTDINGPCTNCFGWTSNVLQKCYNEEYPKR